MYTSDCTRSLILSLLLIAGFVNSALAGINSHPCVAEQPEDFGEFIEKFTTSASFQYSRIKFPLKTPIILVAEDGETEKTFEFTREKWPLLSEEVVKEERLLDEHGGIYVSAFVVDEPDHKEFEAGYEESELDLRLVFDRIEGKWYLTDCYTGWYGFDLVDMDLPEAIKEIQEANAAFVEEYP